MTKENPFSKWLVASDIDGTLNNKRRKLPGRNLRAISEFVEKGGLFTLASGRNPQSMYRHYRKLPLNNIPGIVMNGAGIYDFEKKEMVWFEPISLSTAETICKIAKKFHTVDTIVVSKNQLYITGIGLWGTCYVIIDRLTHEHHFDINKVPKNDWGKVIFSGPPWRVNKIKKQLDGMNDTDFITMFSSSFSVEVLAKDANKGSAVMKLAEMYNIDPSHTAGLGNYYNDKELLEAVGVSGLAGNAPSKLKTLADIVTCHCDKGAVAEFLNYLITEKIRN